MPCSDSVEGPAFGPRGVRGGTHILITGNGYVWLMRNLRPSDRGNLFEAEMKLVQRGAGGTAVIDPSGWRLDINVRNGGTIYAIDDPGAPLSVRTENVSRLVVEPA